AAVGVGGGPRDPVYRHPRPDVRDRRKGVRPGGRRPLLRDRVGALQPDDKIVVAGTAPASGQMYAAFAVARLNPNGSLDTSFGNAGVAVVAPAGGLAGAGSETPAALVVQSDGKIVLASTVQTAPGDVNGDGTLDVFSIAAFNGGPRTALYDGKDVLVARAA